MNQKVDKIYEAVTVCSHTPGRKSWTVKNRLVKGEPWFRMTTVPGPSNAMSQINFIRSKNNRALFKLHPVTGKKHQLRLHLCELGFPILNDHYYPVLLPEKKDEFSAPLQLVARTLSFRDPVSGRQMTYESEYRLISDKQCCRDSPRRH